MSDIKERIIKAWEDAYCRDEEKIIIEALAELIGNLHLDAEHNSFDEWLKQVRPTLATGSIYSLGKSDLHKFIRDEIEDTIKKLEAME